MPTNTANVIRDRGGIDAIPARHTAGEKSSRVVMAHIMLLYLFTLVFLFSGLLANARGAVPERRKDQFPRTSAYLVAPLPYSYPGIGEGAFILGNFSNLNETSTDFLAMYVAGDAGGYILQADELPLIDEHLFVKAYYQNIDRAVVNNYDKRGMEGTGKYDFTLIDISLARETTLVVDLTYFERRLDFFVAHTESEFEVQALRDHNGRLIRQLDEPYRDREKHQYYGMALDLTDDYMDPRKGVRFKLGYQEHPAEQPEDASYYVLDYKLLAYLPLFDTDTLVFHYFQSNAHVRKQGNTNPAFIRQELGMNCAPLDSECLQTEQELVDIFINQRTNGTASSIGGKERLRAYPQERFQGGHSAFFGMEYRWNFKQGVAPFNYLFWKDVRTGLQLALFAEIGTVSETSDRLWNETRESYGAGLRLVAASGAVYRADLAFGDEGAELVIFFFYPWE